MFIRSQEWIESGLSWLSRYEKPLLLLFSIGYFALAGTIAKRALLWNDEIFTYYFASFPDLEALYTDLRNAADQQPPLFYILTRLTHSLAGGELGLRLPSVAGIWLACLSAYVFLRRRLGPAPAWCGALTLLICGAVQFGYEARPYGPVLGVYGLLAVSWQSAVLGIHRRWALAMVSVLVFLLGSLHYLAVLFLLPFAVAEIVRWKMNGRLDSAMAAAFLLGAAPLSLYLPLLIELRQFATVFWSRPSLMGSVIEGHGLLTDPFVGILLLPMALLFLLAARKPGTGRPDPVPLHEAWLVGSLLLTPILLPVVIRLLAGGFTGRYVSCAAFGIALAAGWAVGRLTGGHAAALMASLVLFASVASVHLLDQSRAGLRHRTAGELKSVSELLRKDQTPPQVFIDSPLLFLECWHHASPVERSRLNYAASPAEAVRLLGTDSPEQSLLRLSRTHPMNVRPLSSFASGSFFLLVRSRREFTWIGRWLSESGAEMRIQRDLGGMQLMSVRMP